MTASWPLSTSPQQEHKHDHDSGCPVRNRHVCCRPCAGSDDPAKQEPGRSQGCAQGCGQVTGLRVLRSPAWRCANELAASGFLTKGKRHTFALTDAGRERALRFLGVDELPARTNWSSAIGRYLFPKAAGLSVDAAAKLDSGDKLAAFILKRKYELAGRAGSTVSQILEAVVCKELGFSDETTLNGVLCVVLSRLVGSERLAKDKLAQQLPLFETGLASIKADAARNKVVRDWLGGAPRPVEATLAEPFDMTAFAATVRAARRK